MKEVLINTPSMQGKIKIGKDVLKTLRRYLGKIVILALISYPMSLIVGLADTIHPVIATLLDLPVIYAVFIYLSYRHRVNDDDASFHYRDSRNLPDKFYFVAESVRILQEEGHTLATDAIAFYILYVPILLIPAFFRDYQTYVLVKYILVAITFPLFDMLVMLLVRRKWFKEYDEFRKEKKYQEFQG